MKEGESPYVKYKGKGTIAKFTLIHKGEVIEPWKGKNAEIMEWMRNSSALLAERREEIATFWKVEDDQVVYYEGVEQKDKKMKMAYFTSERDGHPYDVAYRLLPKSVKVGDKVALEIMGCCSIIGVTKVSAEEIAEGAP